MKRRIFCIAMAILLILTLCGCEGTYTKVQIKPDPNYIGGVMVWENMDHAIRNTSSAVKARVRDIEEYEFTDKNNLETKKYCSLIKADISEVIFNNEGKELPAEIDFLNFDSSYQRYTNGTRINAGNEYIFLISPVSRNSNSSFATYKVSSHCIQNVLSRIMYVGGGDNVYYHLCLDDFIDGAEKSERLNNTGLEECFVAPYETVKERLIELNESVKYVP